MLKRAIPNSTFFYIKLPLIDSHRRPSPTHPVVKGHVRTVVEPDDRLEAGRRRGALRDRPVPVRVLLVLSLRRLPGRRLHHRHHHPVLLLDRRPRGQQRRLHRLRRVARRRRLAEAVAGDARVLSHGHSAAAT